MSGELWRQVYQIGEEDPVGTAVAATRRMYFRPNDSRLTRERAPRPHRFATGGRQNQRAFTLGPQEISGTLVQPLSASEIIELLLLSINGGVTPTGAGDAKLWTFTPGTSLDAATVEWHDGARAWRAIGCQGNSLKIAGNVRDETLVTCEILGREMELNALTGALSERTPDFIEGWETRLYIDDIGDTPGTTQVEGILINWEITIENMLARKFWAQNVNAATGMAIGELNAKATLTFEAASDDAADEFANWDAATQRLVRVHFGGNEEIEQDEHKEVIVDLPGAWEAFDLGGSDEGTRTYQLGLDYVYDETNAFGVQVLVNNDRATAW